MDQGQDELFARLLTMGFEVEEVQKCYEALSITSTTFNLQKATEWLLDRSSAPKSKPSGNTLVLTPSTGHTPPTIPDINKPTSSSRDLGSGTSEEPLTSRHNLSSSHVREKERFALKEREEAVKKARERRRGDFLAREQLRKQIQDDRRALQDRTGKATPIADETTPTPSKTTSTPGETTPEAGQDAGGVSTPTTCRVQVRLPSGRVLRRVFPSSDTLNDVIKFVVTSGPGQPGVGMMLIQPFPHHEYTPEEGQRSLEALGLCPSASLVVKNREKQKEVSFTKPPEPMDTNDVGVANSGDEKMEEYDSNNSDSDSEDDGNVPLPLPAPRANIGPPGNIGLPMPGGPPMPGGNIGPPMPGGNIGPPMPGGNIGLPMPPMVHHPLPRGGPRRHFNPFHPVGDDTFSGSGHRLGGKEEPVVMGDTKSARTRQAAKAAAIKRVSNPAPPSGHTSSHTPTLSSALPSLETLCVRLLVSHSNKYGMPSCSSISPRLAQKLLAALKQDKKLNSKTLMAFYKCPIVTLNLDNYLFATGEFLTNLSHFSQLTELSLCSCPIITDKAMLDLLPYLPSLSCLRLNGCSQLTQAMFRSLRGCKVLEVLELSQVKVSDEGLRVLLYYSLGHLKELDLSYTQVTPTGLRLLPAGVPLLEKLNIESTQINDYSALPSLPHLRNLNLAHCPTPSEQGLGVLGACCGLEVLNLSGMVVEGICLEGLAGLSLTTLKLPDRNLCSDVVMETVAAFPLTSLDLTDYLHITDVGVACLLSTTSLTSLSLSRTKLTDAGMPFLEGLQGLRELCLDNTLITDAGISHVAGLVCLELLSLADTRVTSQFILDGVLKELRLLNKLNLSRTAVCDTGILSLSLPSLTMLNLDWTCVTEAVSLAILSNTGCPVLETLRNRNICQPLPPGHRLAGVQRSQRSPDSDEEDMQ